MQPTALSLWRSASLTRTPVTALRATRPRVTPSSLVTSAETLFPSEVLGREFGGPCATHYSSQEEEREGWRDGEGTRGGLGNSRDGGQGGEREGGDLGTSLQPG